MSPALKGGFFSTAPPGKPREYSFTGGTLLPNKQTGFVLLGRYLSLGCSQEFQLLMEPCQEEGHGKGGQERNWLRPVAVQ